MRKLVAELVDATSSEVALSGYGTATVGARVEYRWRPLFNAAMFG